MGCHPVHYSVVLSPQFPRYWISQTYLRFSNCQTNAFPNSGKKSVVQKSNNCWIWVLPSSGIESKVWPCNSLNLSVSSTAYILVQSQLSGKQLLLVMIISVIHFTCLQPDFHRIKDLLVYNLYGMIYKSTQKWADIMNASRSKQYIVCCMFCWQAMQVFR